MTALRETVTKLEIRLAHLEEVIQGLIRQRESSKPATDLPHTGAMTQTQLLLWLKTQGVVREPTTAEARLAAEWQSLPESTKREQIRIMRQLVLQQPLSQTILEARP